MAFECQWSTLSEISFYLGTLTIYGCYAALILRSFKPAAGSSVADAVVMPAHYFLFKVVKYVALAGLTALLIVAWGAIF